MSDRCTGHCCRYFTLGPPEDVERYLELSIVMGGEAAVDAQKVKSLLIYRGYFINPLNLDQEPGHWYTCRHFVVDDNYMGYCQIYKDRPVMCHEYPNGQPCSYAKTGCTWDWAHKPQRPFVDVQVWALARKKREAEAIARGEALLAVPLNLPEVADVDQPALQAGPPGAAGRGDPPHTDADHGHRQDPWQARGGEELQESKEQDQRRSPDVSLAGTSEELPSLG